MVLVLDFKGGGASVFAEGWSISKRSPGFFEYEGKRSNAKDAIKIPMSKQCKVKLVTQAFNITFVSLPQRNKSKNSKIRNQSRSNAAWLSGMNHVVVGTNPGIGPHCFALKS